MPGYLDGVVASTFDPGEYLLDGGWSGRDNPRWRELEWWRHAEARRRLCERDPLLFALLYVPHHLRWPANDPAGVVSISDFHLDLCRDALARYTVKTPSRVAYIAARGGGKSTWCFLILPLWALANRHRKFVAAFGDSSHKAQDHLDSFMREIEGNALLRQDRPVFTRPTTDRKSQFVSQSAVAFTAAGIGSSILGAKIGNQRPDLLLLDDVEGTDGTYTTYQKDQRLATILQGVLPMNTEAALTMVGTVNMPGSIMHDILRYATEPNAEDLEAWVREQEIAPRYYPILVPNDDGDLVSTWPERYPTAWCLSQQHLSTFQLSMMNDPRGRDGGYWTAEDFVYEEPDESYTRWVLEIDPAVSVKVTSDWTGLAVVAAQPPRANQRACVVDAWQVRAVGAKLRERVLKILTQYPRIRAVRVEVNNGGEYIPEALHDLPVKLLTHTSTVGKDVRHAWALDHYQRRRVTHAKRLRVLEDEMISYPKGANDDVSDAAVSGLLYFLEKPKPLVVTGSAASYA